MTAAANAGVAAASPLDLTAPTLRRRMACWLYEGMLLFGVVFISGYLFGTLSQTRNAMDNRHPLQAFLFVIFGIYFVWFWSKGQTLAMKTWHIRMVDRHGHPVSQTRALLRYIAGWVWFLPPLALASLWPVNPAWMALIFVSWVMAWAGSALWHPQHQFWHDTWSGTRLVNSLPLSR